jgi:uncharacterized membrane protein YqhA
MNEGERRDARGASPEKGGPRHYVSRLISWSRYFVVLAMFSLFVAFMALMVSSVVATVTAIIKALGGDLTQKDLVYKLVQQADTALLATVLYVIALGLYSLFVDDRIPMPAWLRIRHLGDLKELLASVIIVVIAVIFLGYALTWDQRANLLVPGLSSAAVIAALSLFLWQAGRERDLEWRMQCERERPKEQGPLSVPEGGASSAGADGEIDADG